MKYKSDHTHTQKDWYKVEQKEWRYNLKVISTWKVFNDKCRLSHTEWIRSLRKTERWV